MERWPFVVQYTLYVASTSLAVVVLVTSGAFVKMMLDPNIANDPIYKIIGPAFQDIIISFISLVAAVGAYIAGRDAGRKEASTSDQADSAGRGRVRATPTSSGTS